MPGDRTDEFQQAVDAALAQYEQYLEVAELSNLSGLASTWLEEVLVALPERDLLEL